MLLRGPAVHGRSRSRARSTRTSSSATIIIFTLSWNPAHTSGNDSLKKYGLKKISRTLWSAVIYLRTGTCPKSIVNHFFCSLAIVPFAQSFAIAALTGGTSGEPFWNTAPYCSCVTIWPATGP